VIDQLHGYMSDMTDWEIVAAAHRFALLGDPTRLRILHTVIEHGELSVGAIAQAAGASRFNTSAHLNRLAAGGLVARRREASTVYYRVEDDTLPEICDAMCESLRHRRLAVSN
jgi:DNA-binding transcriptional ArsR family regulator